MDKNNPWIILEVCLYLQRRCSAVLRVLLGISLWAVVCCPQPITARRVGGAGLCKNVVTSCQIMACVTTRNACALSLAGGDNFECCIYKHQPTNPTFIPLSKRIFGLRCLFRRHCNPDSDNYQDNGS